MPGLDWHHAVTDIPTGGLGNTWQATPAERGAIAKALGLTSLGSLAAEYRIVKLAGDGYRLTGRVIAGLEQACVVTLEPVPQKIDEAFDAEFRSTAGNGPSSHDARILGEPDQELIENGEIAVGRVVFETLSAALDPYIRKDGAEFDWSEKPHANGGKTSPFAVLVNLKNKS